MNDGCAVTMLVMGMVQYIVYSYSRCPDLVTGAHRYCPNPGKPTIKCDIKSEWQENVVKIGQVPTPPYTDTAASHRTNKLVLIARCLSFRAAVGITQSEVRCNLLYLHISTHIYISTFVIYCHVRGVLPPACELCCKHLCYLFNISTRNAK